MIGLQKAWINLSSRWFSLHFQHWDVNSTSLLPITCQTGWIYFGKCILSKVKGCVCSQFAITQPLLTHFDQFWHATVQVQPKIIKDMPAHTLKTHTRSIIHMDYGSSQMFMIKNTAGMLSDDTQLNSIDSARQLLEQKASSPAEPWIDTVKWWFWLVTGRGPFPWKTRNQKNILTEWFFPCACSRTPSRLVPLIKTQQRFRGENSVKNGNVQLTKTWQGLLLHILNFFSCPVLSLRWEGVWKANTLGREAVC